MPRKSTGGPEDQARDQAMRLLAVRSRSKRELTDRLRAKGHTEERVDRVLDRLIELGLVDDEKFALERARSLGRSKGWGPRKLRSDLFRRGIAAELVERAVTAAFEGVSVVELMRALVVKRLGEESLAPDGDRKLRSKAYRYLLGKGFEPEQVQDLFTGE